jgi:hypothetical protein
MDIKKAKEIIEKYKSINHNDEFNKMYEKYESKVEEHSGGLVTTNKADFIKLYAFYNEVIHPDIIKLWKAYLKQ